MRVTLKVLLAPLSSMPEIGPSTDGPSAVEISGAPIHTCPKDKPPTLLVDELPVPKEQMKLSMRTLMEKVYAEPRPRNNYPLDESLEEDKLPYLLNGVRFDALSVDRVYS